MTTPTQAGPRAAPLIGPIAPPWHTAILMGWVLAVAVIGSVTAGMEGRAVVAEGSRFASYAALFATQIVLVLFVTRIGRGSSALLPLLGAPPRTARAALVDVALAAGLAVLIVGVEAAWATWLAPGQHASVTTLLPHSTSERMAWVLIGCAVGAGEEIVYRGYLQAQWTAFTGSGPLAILIQALIFAVAHGQQGPGAMVRIGVHGVAFGVLARHRRGLWPGILCHAGIDVAAGLAHG